MAIKDQAKIILKDVGKGLKGILYPAPKGEKPIEKLVLHYCEKCQKYHRAE